MLTYFNFYGIPPRFHVDEGELRKLYLQLQKQWHPDFFIADPENQEKALLMTSKNNDAYKALSTLEARVQYILREIGLDEGTEKNILPVDFLAEMMELNDLISDAQSGNADAASEAEKMLHNLESEERQLLEQVTLAFDQSGQEFDEVSVKPVRMVWQKLRYLGRLRKNLNGVAEF